MLQANTGTDPSVPICTVCGCSPRLSLSGSVGRSLQKTSRCSLIFNQTHVPTYAITTREGKAIATRRSHLRARIIAELYSKSGVIAYIEAFSIQSARIGASWAVGRQSGSDPRLVFQTDPVP